MTPQLTGHILATGGADVARESTFWILAVVATVAGVGMVLSRRAVHCAVLLAVVMLSLAVLYALQGAPFLAFVQVIVYTGAVLMLFLFVLMIVGSARPTPPSRRSGGSGSTPPWRASACSSCSSWSSGTRPSARRPGVGGVRLGEPHRDRHAAVHQVRVPVRDHQRAADHGRARRDGAGPPRAAQPPADPAPPVAGADRQRAPHAAARPGHVRAAQRGRHAGPAAGRLDVGPSVSEILTGPADAPDDAQPGDRPALPGEVAHPAMARPPTACPPTAR